MSRFTRMIIIVFVLSSLLSPRPASAAPDAPAISVSPGSAAPGTIVQIKGTGFSSNGVPRVAWDNGSIDQIFMAQGQPNADGSFVINVAVPPDATAGDHTWWVVSPVRTGGYETASVPFKVSLPTHTALYLYNTDSNTATGYKTLLEARGVNVTTLALSSLNLKTSLSSYELIIVGPDTGSLDTWGSAEQVLALIFSGKPILGMGEGGYAFFGRLGSPIGYPNGVNDTRVDTLQAQLPSDPLFNTPYKIPLSNNQIQVLNTVGSMIGIGPKQVGSRTYPFAVAANYPSDLGLIQAGKFFLWGFDSSANGLTSDGARLYTNAVYYLLDLLKKDTLVLSNLSRMSSLGYASADVTALSNKINELVGKPYATSNMNAVWRDLAYAAPTSVTNAYSAWTNLSSVSLTNTLVSAIDGYIEQLKRGAYPNLRYVILVGSHEIIPMKVRPADNYVENDWGIPAGYMYDLYHSGTNGSYLTDSVYGDLSYINNSRGADNELLPELAVGRLVETPTEITSLISTYIASSGTMSRTNLAAIASNDYRDGARAAANAMGTSADTSLNLDGFNSSLVPPLINAKHGVVYIGGHGDYNWMTTQKWGQGFMAGSTGSQGDTEELVSIPNAVIAAAGCHNGFNMTNQLYKNYDGTTNYGDFPERLANKQVGVYVGATGYTWITLTGTGTNVADVGFSERLASSFVDHLLNDGGTTAGKAFQAAASQYMTERPTLANSDRRVLSIATFYGIPNYRWQTIFHPFPVKFGYALKSVILLNPPIFASVQAPDTTLQVTADITDWSLDNGIVEIPGASYYGDENYPVLPVISTHWVLPGSPTNINLSLDTQASSSTTIDNDIPTLQTGTVIDPALGTIFEQPKTINLSGLYPDPLAYSYTTTSSGEDSTTLAMSLVPVQYNPTTHKTTIWTHLVFDLSYTPDSNAASIDSDGDGLPDYWENSYGLDPSSAEGDNGPNGDPDHDQLTNQQEFQLGTDPLNPDTDHDGASDGLEVRMGTDPLDPGSTAVQVWLPILEK